VEEAAAAFEVALLLPLLLLLLVGGRRALPPLPGLKVVVATPPPRPLALPGLMNVTLPEPLVGREVLPVAEGAGTVERWTVRCLEVGRLFVVVVGAVLKGGGWSLEFWRWI
jgi:hypothetical protein